MGRGLIFEGQPFSSASRTQGSTSVPEEIAKKRGRPPKFDPVTARRLLVEEGADALRLTGLSPGLDTISLERAINATEVPRGAAYRVWGTEDAMPQEQFRTAVLLRMFEEDVAEEVFSRVDRAVTEALEEYETQVKSTDPTTRSSAMRSIVRLVTGTLHEAMRTSETYKLSRSIALIASGGGVVSEEVQNAVEQAERALFERYRTLLSDLFGLFDVDIVPPYTIDHLVLIGNALNEGLLHGWNNSASTVLVMRPTGPGGEMEEWSLLALGIDAALSFMTRMS